MAITLNGTTGITTPDITSSGALGVDASAPDNSLVVDSSGNVGIGTSSPSSFTAENDSKLTVGTGSGNSGITVYTGNTSQGGIFFADGTSGASTYSGILRYNHSANAMLFYTNGLNERARIDSSGNLLVNQSTSGDAGKIKISTGEWTIGSRVSGSATPYGHIAFYNPNGLVGYISTSGTTTAYSTSSDYRLKENVVGVTGAAARVQQLNPVRFNFIADPNTTVDGFLAHEVQDVVPEAITGTKDAVETYTDDEGNEQTRPVYQGIDQSKLVPLLTAALQEALAEIETLKARVSALEAA